MHELLIASLPVWLTYAFYAVVAWGVAAVLATFRTISSGTSMSLLLRVGFVVWLVVPAWLANAGTLAQFEAVPPMLVRVVVPAAVIVTAVSLSPAGMWVAKRLPLTLLVGFQAFRLPLEIVLHQLAERGVLPVQMTFTGWNFDILTGASALVLWFLLRRGYVSPKVLKIWNVAGLLLLCTIVTLAVLAFPKPFGLFTPQNRIVAYFPWVWLPTFLVQLALFGHLLMFRKLASLSEEPAREGAVPGTEAEPDPETAAES